MIIRTPTGQLAVTRPFNMRTTKIICTMDIYIFHTTGMWMNMSLQSERQILLIAHLIIHAVLTIPRMFTVPHVDMKRYHMAIMLITWLMVTCIILMVPTVMIMGWFKSANI
ncbi:MAG: hypothetical protein NPIRA02_22230 [Nitrospirales bacterium]|nr:MAG: hypothetical protein NPIRA02_22230 [Nitrospirales bacterium]